MTDTVDKPPPLDRRAMTDRERRESLVRLLLITAIVVGLSVTSGSLPFLLVVVALVAMVMLHELGHFLVAKWSGMKVTEYFLGFGPRLWSVRKGETEYGVKAIPAGGYVRIVGMNNVEQVDPADEARTYREQSFPRRLAVAVAGSAMHFVIAFVLLLVLMSAVGLPTLSRRVGQISGIRGGQSPAQEAGFQVGDQIESVDGHRVSRWDDLPPYIRARVGQPITFVVSRHGHLVTLTAVPADANPDGTKQGFIGISSQEASRRLGPISGIGRAASDLGRISLLSVKGVGLLFTPGHLKSYADQLTNNGATGTLASKGDPGRPVSVVGFTRVAGQAAQQHRFAELLYLLVLINVFVGIFNMIPLLPFDGGHVAIAVYERLRSRRGRRYQANAAKLMPVAAAVITVMVVFGAAIVYLDIVRPVSLQ